MASVTNAFDALLSINDFSNAKTKLKSQRKKTANATEHGTTSNHLDKVLPAGIAHVDPVASKPPKTEVTDPTHADERGRIADKISHSNNFYEEAVNRVRSMSGIIKLWKDWLKSLNEKDDHAPSTFSFRKALLRSTAFEASIVKAVETSGSAFNSEKENILASLLSALLGLSASKVDDDLCGLVPSAAHIASLVARLSKVISDDEPSSVIAAVENALSAFFEALRVPALQALEDPNLSPANETSAVAAAVTAALMDPAILWVQKVRDLNDQIQKTEKSLAAYQSSSVPQPVERATCLARHTQLQTRRLALLAPASLPRVAFSSSSSSSSFSSSPAATPSASRALSALADLSRLISVRLSEAEFLYLAAGTASGGGGGGAGRHGDDGLDIGNGGSSSSGSALDPRSLEVADLGQEDAVLMLQLSSVVDQIQNVELKLQDLKQQKADIENRRNLIARYMSTALQKTSGQGDGVRKPSSSSSSSFSMPISGAVATNYHHPSSSSPSSSSAAAPAAALSSTSATATRVQRYQDHMACVASLRCILDSNFVSTFPSSCSFSLLSSSSSSSSSSFSPSPSPSPSPSSSSSTVTPPTSAIPLSTMTTTAAAAAAAVVKKIRGDLMQSPIQLLQDAQNLLASTAAALKAVGANATLYRQCLENAKRRASLTLATKSLAAVQLPEPKDTRVFEKFEREIVKVIGTAESVTQSCVDAVESVVARRADLVALNPELAHIIQIQIQTFEETCAALVDLKKSIVEGRYHPEGDEGLGVAGG
eukprot:CAMPEP_0175049354 /NCGR_PEP_ID=MMETSP0052_2-20121109/6686_1 /TAXON_ID=51329 ORGANISM="Polytomella parva, Strain SAG 63-3" /NCGR_SAMPLE_ID=MMETSP0052_2 /ASSEMBLY_ACC=CAM_ASM_000194 /LENGTH=767 /DNA_ID=CAMNT_0016313495 /DNA_START=48 /DNA_END=2347 /DNA_ORIENTATION=-